MASAAHLLGTIYAAPRFPKGLKRIGFIVFGAAVAALYGNLAIMCHKETGLFKLLADEKTTFKELLVNDVDKINKREE